MQLVINIENKKARAQEDYRIVCGNSDYTILFSFDSEWDGYETKTAHFSFLQGNVRKYIDVAFSGSTCKVPILVNIKSVEVGVFAGELRTTTPCLIKCEKSALCDGGALDTPPNNMYERVSEMIGEAVDEATDKILTKVGEGFAMTSQGRSVKYAITSSGWKRILNVIRATSGTVNLGLANGLASSECKQVHMVAFDFTGFVQFPGQLTGAPVLLKRYDNFFGEGDERFKIMAVRIAYPAYGASFEDRPAGSPDYSVTPVNCYVDVYVDIDTTQNKRVDFTMNFSGFADSHNCVPITKETEATGTGIYGEGLEFSTYGVGDDHHIPMYTYLTNKPMEFRKSGRCIRVDDYDHATNLTIKTDPNKPVRVLGKNLMPTNYTNNKTWILSIPAGTCLTVSCDDVVGLGDVRLNLYLGSNANPAVHTVKLSKVDSNRRRYGTVWVKSEVTYAMWEVEGATGGVEIPYGQVELSQFPTKYAEYTPYTYVKADAEGYVFVMLDGRGTFSVIADGTYEVVATYSKNLRKLIENLCAKVW